LKPGARTELHLIASTRRALAGHIGRCRVARLMPLHYEGAIVFDEPLDP